MVAIEGIAKSFDEVTALHPCFLDIREGEFFSLLGPSGCGKTTLLRIIGGFEKPTAGRLSIAGESVLGLSPARRRTNMIFQHLALFPHMTVRDNVAFGLRMRHAQASEIDKKVNTALAMVQMEPFAKRNINALSGGQKQRIAIARALVNEPAVLLLDEPLSALDLQLRIQMQSELRRLQRSLGSTFIFVTHDQEEAMTMSDRIAVMQSGRILQVGTPREIYQRPKTRFVAEFIGHSNFVQATMASRVREGFYAFDCNGLTMKAACCDDLQVGTAATIALRYEAIDVRSEVSDGAHPATIEQIIFAGAYVRFELRLANGISMTAERSAMSADSSLIVGSAVFASWDDDAATAFSVT